MGLESIWYFELRRSGPTIDAKQIHGVLKATSYSNAIANLNTITDVDDWDHIELHRGRPTEIIFTVEDT